MNSNVLSFALPDFEDVFVGAVSNSNFKASGNSKSVGQLVEQLTDALNELDRSQNGVASPNPIQVLLIEDAKADVVLVQKMLVNSRDYYPGRTFTVTNVARICDALEMLSENMFDVALLDLNLLDKSGTENVELLHLSAPNLPIIVYSGSVDDSVQEQAILFGAYKYIQKSYQGLVKLKSIIHEIIQKKLYHQKCVSAYHAWQ